MTSHTYTITIVMCHKYVSPFLKNTTRQKNKYALCTCILVTLIIIIIEMSLSELHTDNDIEGVVNMDYMLGVLL